MQACRPWLDFRFIPLEVGAIAGLQTGLTCAGRCLRGVWLPCRGQSRSVPYEARGRQLLGVWLVRTEMSVFVPTGSGRFAGRERR